MGYSSFGLPKGKGALLVALLLACSAGADPVPLPKKMNQSDQWLDLASVRIRTAEDVPSGEPALLRRMLEREGIVEAEDGVLVRVRIGGVEVPESSSRYREEIQRQAYRIVVADDSVIIEGNSGQGLFYALQTFDQMLDGTRLPVEEIVDWPDLPLRMIMVDPARQNESMDYYRRMIDFAARYKINAVLCHLTDDQTSALFHEEYPELLHDHAWRAEEIKELTAYAEQRHVRLIPEIETLGHSRMFERLPDFKDYLHQTKSERPDESWMGTDIPGYTNVLCPASPKAAAYLERMYERASSTFDHPWIHIGFDEVDMTDCTRCTEAFGELTPDQWMAKAFEKASGPIVRRGRRTAMWGDMLRSHPGVVESISPTDTIIFDWYYRPDVTDESVLFFTGKGFEVVASPALAASPHMVMPNRRNYDNIARFTEIARKNDLLGINTTIWVPVRYMSDVLWTGVAYSAAHAWGGSNYDDGAFFGGFAEDFFEIDEGEAFRAAHNRLAEVLWHRPEFYAGCWADAESLEAARKMVTERGDEIAENIRVIAEVRTELDRIGETVGARQVEWKAIGDSAAILQYSMEHLLAAVRIGDDPALVADLDVRCMELMQAIEADWDRNRFADDPGKDGRFLQNQHLLFRFRQMHAFHQELITAE